MEDEINFEGVVITPGLSPGVFVRIEKNVWDNKISPKIASIYYPRYQIDSLIGAESQIFKDFKKEKPQWWIIDVFKKMEKIMKRHSNTIPKSEFSKLDIPKNRYDDASGRIETHRVLGIQISINRGIYTPYLVTEHYKWNYSFRRFTKEFSIMEMHSEFSNAVLSRYNHRESVYFQNFFNSIHSIIDLYQIYLLGEEGVEEYIATIPDRELVDALNQGAYFTKKGTILNPVTGNIL